MAKVSRNSVHSKGSQPCQVAVMLNQPTLTQLAGATGFTPTLLFKAQQALFQLPGQTIAHGISRTVRIPSSWQIIGHLLSIHGGAAPSARTSLKGEQRAQFNMKVASSRGALQISARIIFRRAGTFLTLETPKALIQIVVRIVSDSGTQEHLQEVYLSGTGKLTVRVRTNALDEFKGTHPPKKDPHGPLAHGDRIQGGLIPVPSTKAKAPNLDCLAL